MLVKFHRKLLPVVRIETHFAPLWRASEWDMPVAERVELNMLVSIRPIKV